MKKILVSGFLVLSIFSQAQAAITIRTLSCSTPAVNGHNLLGMKYSIHIITRSAISGHGTSFYLISQAVSPAAPIHREELKLKGEDAGWLELLGKNSVVDIEKGFRQAKIGFSSGAESICK